jgi:hypothetical protein
VVKKTGKWREKNAGLNKNIIFNVVIINELHKKTCIFVIYNYFCGKYLDIKSLEIDVYK